MARGDAVGGVWLIMLLDTDRAGIDEVSSR